MWKVICVTIFLLSSVAAEEGDSAHPATNTQPPPIPPDPNTQPLTLEDILLQVQLVRMEVDIERRLRTQAQSLAAVNEGSIRRLQRSLLVSARETRDALARVRQEQIRLEQVMLQQSDQTDVMEQVNSLREDVEAIKTELRNLESAVATRAAPATEVPETGLQVAAANITATIDSLAGRVTATEEKQILLENLIEESNDALISKLRRKIRHLKNDLESRIRDYNGAMTTFASDMRILRQELQRNVVNIQTSMSVENRRFSDSLHVLKASVNRTSDEFKENMYYIAKAQQEQMASHTELELQVHDMRGRAAAMMTSLHDMDAHLSNVTDMVWHMRRDAEPAQGLVELQLEVLCPHPYVKSGSYCFSILQENLSWQGAHQQCAALARGVGGEGGLATAPHDTHPIRSFVRRNNDQLVGDTYVWVGASSTTPDHSWSWVGGDALNHDLFPWDRSEPDPTEDQAYLCIKVSGGALFHNCINTSLLYAVCQLQSDPLVGKSITFSGLRQQTKRERGFGFSTDLLFGSRDAPIATRQGNRIRGNTTGGP